MHEGGLIAHKPAKLSFEEASALSFGGTTVLSPLRDTLSIKHGDRIPIVGASGGVGTAAVQIARGHGWFSPLSSARFPADLVRWLRPTFSTSPTGPHMSRVSVGLMLLCGLGSTIGSAMASFGMQWFGPVALLGYRLGATGDHRLCGPPGN